MESQQLQCCAVTEIHGISEKGSTPKEQLIELIQHGGSDGEFSFEGGKTFGPPFAIFTGAIRGTGEAPYAKAFAAFIKDQDLGTVNRSKPRKNRTGNTVTVYLWTIDQVQLAKFWVKNDPDREAEEEDGAEDWK